jgi:hypothetical protein
MKIAVCTSFPNNYWNICAAEMLASFKAYWPEDIKIFIQLDEQSSEDFKTINNQVVTVLGERCFIASAWDDEQKAFQKKYESHVPQSYMFDVVRFSHKVFALEKCADALDGFDYLIWLDADVITKKPITYDWLKEVLPEGDQVVSYLGRPYVGYSECGFVGYNLKAGAKELLKSMKQMYIDDTFKQLQAWTDCHILDFNIIGKPVKNLSEHCNKQTGLDVWPHTKLAEKTVHRKGDRKVKAAQARKQEGGTDLNNLKIQTRNCLDHEKICANVKENIQQIRNWATILKPTNREIVLCAAGPSLVNHIEEIKRHQKLGAYVITVKHAIETLKENGIKPDACVLLDPRGHVEKFVKEPDQDVVYFVASMVDPSVVKTLNDNRCTVIGYHAAVNAGETKEMTLADMPIAGGSATSTRTIHMFADMFGYKTFHLYGYDLSHQKKPDLSKKNEDGQPQVFEETFKVMSQGGKQVERTFWTEGQFLAQAQELRNLYKDRKDITINLYGDGMAAWMIRHQRLYDDFIADYNQKVADVRANSITLEDFINAATRANEFSRRTSR